INGKEICVWLTPDKSFFAFSAASFKRCVAILSWDKSMPFSLRNSATIQSIIFWSKSRSEEHTSELQSRFDLVCRLLLEKKNIFLTIHNNQQLMIIKV